MISTVGDWLERVFARGLLLLNFMWRTRMCVFTQVRVRRFSSGRRRRSHQSWVNSRSWYRSRSSRGGDMDRRCRVVIEDVLQRHCAGYTE